MQYMLDTNILIYLIKNHPPSVAHRIDALPESATLCMSFVNYAELLKGAERSTKKADVLRQLAQLTRLIEVNYAADASLCQHFAEQSLAPKEAGTPIGADDLWIASHALAQGCTVVTNNVREFSRVRGLELENWAVTS